MFGNDQVTAMMLFCLYLVLNPCIGSYFVSQNPLSWSLAESHCADYCSSHLVSIHNETQFNTIKEILSSTLNATNPPLDDTITAPYIWPDHNPNIWIGLHRTGANLFDLSWTDGSQFDFNSSWDDEEGLNEPNNLETTQACVALNPKHNYKWDDIEDEYEMRFVCNSCAAKTNKYILIKLHKQWADAQSYCRDKLGTDLASIHNEDDYLEAKALCRAECWIGFNDLDLEGNWVWSDATSSDFGSATTGGIYPWRNITEAAEPNDYYWYDNKDGEDCVMMLNGPGDDNRWNDESCVLKEYYFICNAQSELCTKRNWQYTGDLLWSEDDVCQLESKQMSKSIVYNRKWTHGDDIWLVDYMYTVHNVHNNNGESGILIYHFQNICDYYFVGIGIDAEDNNATIIVDKYFDGISTRVYESQKLFTYEFDRYYTLRVQLSYAYNLSSIQIIQWNISIITNEIYSIAYTDTSENADIENDRYIGLKNSDANITAKSLFISDTRQSITDLNVSLEECIIAPTNNSSVIPSNHPSHVPTKQPTKFPTSNPSGITATEAILSTSLDPTKYPTGFPSNDPTIFSSSVTTLTAPTFDPTTNDPTSSPSHIPSAEPSKMPSFDPSKYPTKMPPSKTYNTTPQTGYVSTYTPHTTSGSVSTETSDTTKYKSDNVWLSVVIAFGGFVGVILICITVTIIFHCCNPTSNKFVIENNHNLAMKKQASHQASHERSKSKSFEVVDEMQVTQEGLADEPGNNGILQQGNQQNIINETEPHDTEPHDTDIELATSLSKVDLPDLPAAASVECVVAMEGNETNHVNMGNDDDDDDDSDSMYVNNNGTTKGE